MELLKERNAQRIQSIHTFHHISHDVFQEYLSRASSSLQTTTISISPTNIQTT
jgi:cyclopropane fatty-acyl-phospholipid synthase-like methyltransferase